MNVLCGIVYLSDTNIWHIDNLTLIRNECELKGNLLADGWCRALCSSPHYFTNWCNKPRPPRSP